MSIQTLEMLLLRLHSGSDTFCSFISVYVSICLSVFLSVCLSVCLSVSSIIVLLDYCSDDYSLTVCSTVSGMDTVR